MPRLYHVSETPGLSRFEPQPSHNNPSAIDSVVWAIDEAHLVNYLLPRDCPRVCWLSEGNRHIVAVEWNWFERIRNTRLYLYEFSDDAFELLDLNAGYYISTVGVKRVAVTEVSDPLKELSIRNTELRVLPNLWKLHDEIAASTTEFSMIRMRNALPRDQ